MHYLLPQLQQLDADFPVQRKLLLVPSINYGRELLASLALARGGWVGWETATLATIASRLAPLELARRHRRPASDVAVSDTVSAAFDVAVREGNVAPALASLAWSAGTRRALADAVLELRVAGVSPALLREVGGGSVAGSLAVVLDRFEALLVTREMADAATLFDAAVTAFDAEAPFVLEHAVLVAAPGWSTRGAPRRLFERLVQHGLRVLSLPPVLAAAARPSAGTIAPPVTAAPPAARPCKAHQTPVSRLMFDSAQAAYPPHDVASPTRSPAMFCAGNPADELRAVLRQVVAAGAQLEEVEIVCTDRDIYGASLDSLCAQIGVSCTMLDGLPLASTRVGRVVERWFRWIESGYQSSTLRGAIESGDFAIAAHVGTAAMSAELRRLKIGWGLDATRRAIDTLRSAQWHARMATVEDEPPGVFAERLGERVNAPRVLSDLLEQLVALAPDPALPLSSSALAEQTAQLLATVELYGEADESTRRRVLDRLAEVAAVAAVSGPLSSAIATVRQELSGVRAWTATSATSKPRRATGGHVHLTSLENAGTTGRPHQFIVGLDADRTGGPVVQSPLLPDWLRVRLNERGALLPTTDERRRERAWQLALAIHGSSAALTLSYAIEGGADGRASGPAPLLLEAARAHLNNPALGYGDLTALLGVPRSAVPDHVRSPVAHAEVAIDERDVWLEAMSEGALLLDATPVLREVFPGLDCGLAAAEARALPEVGVHHGLVPGAGALDPRMTGTPISPSSLERIARCGLNWFYATALAARVPDEPVYDPLVWLNALDRGSALHTIYEHVMRAGLHALVPGAERDARLAALVDDVARRVELNVPAPSDAVRTRETTMLHDEAKLFVTSEHDAFRREPFVVVAVETAFGGRAMPAEFTLDSGETILLHGRVDRVDRLADGTLRLVDYKTGRAFELDGKGGAFDGGRKLQLALYSPAISAQLSAPVSRAEYRFTTARGDGVIAHANEAMLAEAPRIVRSLLDDVRHGRFLPTMEPADCRYCDYAGVCRVATSRFSFTSPRASWAKVVGADNAHYAGMRERRGGDDE
jgi:ATP-dependent helicase/nuclease subunit B